MEELKKLFAEHNRLLAEQNNILRAGILVFTKEFSMFRHYANCEDETPVDDFNRVAAGCGGYAANTLHECLKDAESYGDLHR